jgi:hypothetical protein
MRPLYKAFHEAFDLLRKDFNKNKKYLNDKRITFAERQILKSYVALRNNKFSEVFELMDSCSTQNDYFEAHKQLVLGISYNNLSLFSESARCFSQSEKLFHKEEDSYFLFYLYLNWYYLATNTVNSKLAEELINKSNSLEIENNRFIALRELISFDYHANRKDYAKAKKHLNKLKENKRFLYTIDLSAYLIISFNFYMTTDEFDKAQNHLKQLKKIRKYQLTENYKFMSSLMGYLIDDSSIYLREVDLKRTPVLNYQAQTIKHLSYGNVPDALDYWEQLEELDSHLYQDEFDYLGPQNLFFHCLKKAKMNLKKLPQLQLEDLSLEDKLHKLFQNVNDIYLKNDLFFLLYGKEAEGAKDFNKLSKLISRFRKSHSKNIVSSHESYIFKDEGQKTA